MLLADVRIPSPIPMASKPRKSAAKLGTPPADFSAVVRSVVCENPGLNAAGLKKALPVNYQKFATPDSLKSAAVGDGCFVFMKSDLLYKDFGDPVRLQAPYLTEAERRVLFT